jgi:hypothetical protein
VLRSMSCIDRVVTAINRDDRAAGLARMDMKPGVDELRSLSRPIAVYAMRWHENDR